MFQMNPTVEHRCAKCDKLLSEQAVVVKSRKAGKHDVIVESRQALVCPDDGVVTWVKRLPASQLNPWSTSGSSGGSFTAPHALLQESLRQKAS